jgi:hypothetical protein
VDEAPRRPSIVKRVGYASLLALIGVSIWTGSPLFAVWVGSQVQRSSSAPSMTAVFVVVLVLAVVTAALGAAFSRLSARYEELTGQSPTVRQHAPWLRSMRGERPRYEGMQPTLTTGERVLVVVVAVAWVAFEIWFFFFAGSPLGNGGT